MNARINSGKARQRADELEVRLQKRLEELERERRLSPLPPVVMGGALIVPVGLLSRIKGLPETEPDTFARETARIERIAMDAIMELERQLGYEPRDVSAQKCGYDIESRIPNLGCLKFIEEKAESPAQIQSPLSRVKTLRQRPQGVLVNFDHIHSSRNCGRDHRVYLL